MNGASVASHKTQRVILLLDLDCFYAQCECVRLGFDAQTTPLALLQWDSVLAVTYPAREKYDIQRGDSWETIRRKSSATRKTSHSAPETTTLMSAVSNPEDTINQKQPPLESSSSTSSTIQTDASDDTDKGGSGGCYAVHVAVLTTSSSTNAAGDVDDDDVEDVPTSSGADDYASIYQLSPDQQQQARKECLGVRMYASQGKACIERYRVASARIFATVLEWIQQQQQASGSMVLERASIDEFFLDVTEACSRSCRRSRQEYKDDVQDAVRRTVVVGPPPMAKDCTASPDGRQEEEHDDDDELDAMLEHGCWIAHSIRQAVLKKIGFTLSAGISINKTLAKLSTTYGKPDGQAVTFPRAVEYLLQNTKISKCRNFGGKLGKQVQALLPPDVPAVIGSIAKYLSLPILQKGLGDSETARWVYEAARGVDRETVVAKNESGSTKSITAFKSLPFRPGGHSLNEVMEWICLLAQEIVRRVSKDATRINRYPSRCTVHYTVDRVRKSKSVRMLFPPERCSTEEKVNALAEQVPKLIQSKEGKNVRLRGIGLCAVDFVSKQTSNHAIDHYFSARKDDIPTDPTSSESPTNATLKVDSSRDSTPQHEGHNQQLCATAVPATKSIKSEHADLELAKKLQAGFDRENRLFQAMERRSSASSSQPRSKTRRIDSFFLKR